MKAEGASFIARVLDVIETGIVPLTQAGVGQGDKVFGAAILRKADWSLVVAGSNHETANPLWHGEVHTLKRFYELARDQRPETRDCLFIATHEPCSLCLSAITWSGFDNFTFLFGYSDTADRFNIPHDLKILKEVFRIEDGNYARDNAYWTGRGIPHMIDILPDAEQAPLRAQVQAIEAIYQELSDAYQAAKESSGIPLS